MGCCHSRLDGDKVEGDTALHDAARADDDRRASKLLTAGASVYDVNVLGETAMHTAAVNNAKATLALLLQSGAKVDAKNKLGETPLHAAAASHSMDAAELLLDNKADANCTNKEGRTPLHWAAENNSSVVARLLLSKGAYPNIRDQAGHTALHLAAIHRHTDIAALILEAYPDPNTMDKDGNTALAAAVKGNLLELVLLMLEKGATIDLANLELVAGLLQTAARSDDAEIFKILQSRGVDVNIQDEDGDSPLVFAVANNNFALTEYLLSHGADFKHRNKSGRSAYMFSTDKKSTVTALLTSRDADVGAEVVSSSELLIGVSLEDIKEFIVKCKKLRGSKALDNKTVRQVAEEFVKFLTQGRDCAYTKLLETERKRPNKKATVFISHAWSENFFAFVKLLDKKYSYDPGAMLWIDVFCASQHGETKSFEWWSNGFRNVLRNVPQYGLIIPNLQSPAPLGRAWCLYEFYCGVVANAEYEVVGDDNDLKRLEDAISYDLSSLESLLDLIDLGTSQTSIDADKVAILKLVNKYEGGVDAFNWKIKDAVQSYYMRAERDAAVGGEGSFDVEV